MPNLFALLVAIDAYPDPIRKLAGCVNDADAMESLLRKRFGGESLKLLRISNDEAKRARIIESFKQHLGQAQKDDVALFFFAGHGSQVPTGGLFKEIEPDELNESIVCHDSRLPGGFDLVDKDIATLIREVTINGAALTVILDSCHSGGGTRGLDSQEDEAEKELSEAEAAEAVVVRKVRQREDAQPANEYLTDPAETEAMIRSIPEPPQGAGALTLAAAAGFVPDVTGTHVLLAACEDNQTAKEYLGGGKRHGAFSYFLTQTLMTAQEPLGYSELMQLVRARMRDRVADQSPKLEPAGGTRLSNNTFLGMKPAPLADYSLATQRITGIWTIDSGSLLGVAEGDQFALYPDSAEGAELADRAKSLGTAVAAGVRPSETVLALGDGVELLDGAMYKAVLTARSVSITVGMDGDESGLALLRTAMASAVLIREGVDPRFAVHATDGKFAITNGGGDRVLYGPVAYGSADDAIQAAQKVVAALEHMAKWTTRLELSNPSTTIPVEAVQFIITANGAEQSCPPLERVELEYTRDKFGQVTKPFYKARISSSFRQDLFAALLVFSDDFSISTQLLGAGRQRLASPVGCAPDKLPLPVYAASGLEIHCTIVGDATETTDDLMLLVSTDEFDPERFELPGLDAPQTRRMEAEQPAPLHDFFTRRVTFHTTRNWK